MITTTEKTAGTVSESFKGCVVKVYGESVQVMSDIFEYHTYAVVYSADEGAFKTVFLFSDYPSGDEKRTATVDATETVQALYAAHLAVKAAERALLDAQTTMDRLVSEARMLEKGKTLKIVKGRKIALGTVGECVWVGSTSFNGCYPKTRVGLKTADGTVHWTAASNVEVVVGG